MAAAATVPFVTVEEYLRTVYEPDVDYVDGQIEERNLGERDHGTLQMAIAAVFFMHRKEWRIRVTPELRTQTSRTSFRVPDVIVESVDAPKEQIVRTPPLLCIEVLSPEDRWQRYERRIQEYFAMGVPTVWVFDPEQRSVMVLEKDKPRRELREGTLGLEGTPVAVSIAEVFAVLDEQ